MTPLLSICIPTFDRAAFLGATIESIASQVRGPLSQRIELIVVDNASTDGTAALVADLQRGYGFLRYHRNPANVGVIGNFYRCLELASGDYFWLFGDDDLCLPNMLGPVVDFLRPHRHGYVLLNKRAMTADLGSTFIERQNHLFGNVLFEDARDMVATYGMYTQCMFITASILDRRRLLDADPADYLAIDTGYSPIGHWTEACAGATAIATGIVPIIHRQFNQGRWAAKADTAREFSIEFTRLFHTLHRHGATGLDYAEHVREVWGFGSTLSWCEIIVNNVRARLQRGDAIPDAEWALIGELYASFVTPLGRGCAQLLKQLRDGSAAPRA